MLGTTVPWQERSSTCPIFRVRHLLGVARKHDIKRRTFPQKRRLLLGSTTESNVKRTASVGSTTSGAGDAREGTAGDTHVGRRWFRARMVGTASATLCGRSPARIRAVSRPHGPQTVRERSALGGRGAAHSDPLTQGSSARALLTVVLDEQPGTNRATFRTNGDREQSTVQRARLFAE